MNFILTVDSACKVRQLVDVTGGKPVVPAVVNAWSHGVVADMQAYVSVALPAADEHPFGPGRLQAFLDGMDARQLRNRVAWLEPRSCLLSHLLSFHTAEHVERVKQGSVDGSGYLDNGDTPARLGIFEAAGTVLSVEEGRVEVDFNHPLAGHQITFKVEILAVEPPDESAA